MADTVNTLTVTMTVRCEHCSAPVPINGPLRRAHCRNCQREFPIARLHDELALASEGMQRLGSPYVVRWASAAEPQCRKCEKVVPIAELDSIGSTTIACPACGTGLPSYAAPEWLRAKLPAIRRVFGGDPELAGELALELPSTELAPIAMACPQCSGGLSITAADDRVVVCRYCTASVFLPDELWRRLHPAKTMLAWTVSYSGERLVTAEALAEAEAEAERAKAEAERAAAASPRHDAPPKPTPWLLILALVIGVVGFAALYLAMA
ncbi:hypothetical protein ACNOYE_22030 [Nannocystaceae bacterium ST9]